MSRLLYINFDRGIPVLGDKGASVHVREFVRAAGELGHQVLLACARLGSGNAPPAAQIVELRLDRSEEASAGQAAREGGAAASEETLRIVRELSKLIYDGEVGEQLIGELASREYRPDLIYERHALFSSAGVNLARRLGRARILEVNAPLAEEQKRFRGLSLESLARRMEVESFRGADAVVAVSEEVRDYVHAVSGVSCERIHVLPNGVDVRRFACEDAGRELRQRLGYGSGDCAVAFLGSFKPWHGTAFLLEVFAELAPIRPAARLIAVGDGPERASLCARVADCDFRDRVCLPGRVPHAEVPSWVAAADIMVAPYEAIDGFYFSPLKVLEALAGGKPVVAPRLGQLSRLIEHGKTGLLYPPGDALACRDAIRSLIDDPARRRAMGIAARAAAAGQSWQAIVRRVLEIATSTPVRSAA
jgi:glycosyltransferase involved in cell wall biosynthesis